MVVEHQGPVESAVVVLNAAESKRLIAKAVAALPEVKAALEKGTVVINLGTSAVFVAEEILGITVGHKSDFASGVVAEGELNANHPDTKMPSYVLKEGKVSNVPQWQAVRHFRPGDVYVKGANALDVKGDIGIFTAAQNGGSIAMAWFAVTGTGGHLICPVSLGKLIPSVEVASTKCNLYRYKYSIGIPVSMLRFSNAKVITEVQAIEVLSGARAIHVASGGIGGSEGAVVLAIEGDKEAVEKAFRVVTSLKGEAPVPAPRLYTTPRAATLNYDPVALAATNQKDVSGKLLRS